jgi:hypothetical protein
MVRVKKPGETLPGQRLNTRSRNTVRAALRAPSLPAALACGVRGAQPRRRKGCRERIPKTRAGSLKGELTPPIQTVFLVPDHRAVKRERGASSMMPMNLRSLNVLFTGAIAIRRAYPDIAI